MTYPCLLEILKSLQMDDLYNTIQVCRVFLGVFLANRKVLLKSSQYNTFGGVLYSDSRQLYMNDVYFWRIMDSIKNWNDTKNMTGKWLTLKHKRIRRHESLLKKYKYYKKVYNDTINRSGYVLVRKYTEYNHSIRDPIVGDFNDIRKFLRNSVYQGSSVYSVLKEQPGFNDIVYALYAESKDWD